MKFSGPWSLKSFLLLYFLALTPVVTLGFIACHFAAESSRQMVQHGNLSAGIVTRELVQSELDYSVNTLRAVARSPLFTESIQERDEQKVRDILEVHVLSHPQVVRAFVTNVDGLLWSDFPKAPESLGQSFSHRDWYRGLTDGRQPYVSEVYRRHAEPKILLVAVAIPVHDPEGALLGALVHQIDLESLSALLQEVAIGQRGFVFLLDHAGHVAAHPHLDLQAREYLEYAGTGIFPIEDNEPKTINYVDPILGQEMVAAAIPFFVQGQRWLVVVQQPAREASQSMSILRMQIGGAGILVAIGLGVGLFHLSRHQRKIQVLNRDLDLLNQELSEEYRERRRMHETLLANLPGMAYRCRTDPHWVIEFVSEGSSELTGYPPDALVANRATAYIELIHPEDRERTLAGIRQALSQRAAFLLEYRINTHPGNTVKWVRDHGRGVYGVDGRILAFEGLVIDHTEQKVLEEQLLQSQKLEAIGRLAGGVAHDFNNLLTIINGHCALLLLKILPDDPGRGAIDEIAQAGDRAAMLTRQLLAFSRKQVLKPEVLDLNEIVVRMDKLLRRLIGENIDFETHLEPDLDSVKVDRGQMEQIIMNLALNARDAMARGGKLTIATGHTFLDADYARAHPEVRPGPHVMLAVTDTGSGMDAETKAHIFEPFFTTKQFGKGTGLGLATVYGIVKQSGGTIWVYSEPGHGTTFKVYIPRVEGLARTGKSRNYEGDIPKGTGTILVVEDEASVRDLIRRVLEMGGYTVLETGDPETAIALARDPGNEIHLLLTDVIMPKMGGRELATALVALRPGLKTVYMSGYTDEAIVHHGILEPGTAFIEKPISPTALLAKIKSCFS